MNRAARVRRHRAGLCIKCSQPKKDDGRKLCSPCSEFVGKAFDKSMKRVAKREACKIVHRRTVEAELENDNNSIFKGTDFMKKMGLECEMKEEEHPRQRKVPLGTPYGR